MPAGSFTADISTIRAAARPRTAKHADDIVDLSGA
jgi:hypothetical protein